MSALLNSPIGTVDGPTVPRVVVAEPAKAEQYTQPLPSVGLSGVSSGQTLSAANDLSQDFQADAVFQSDGMIFIVQAKAFAPAARLNSPGRPGIQWLRENSQTLSKYRGEWLLISDAGLISHNADFDVIRSAVRQNGITSPFVYYVPTQDEEPFALI